MRKYIILSLLFLSFLEAKLPNYEMERLCKNRVVTKYKLQRAKVYTAVPRYLYGKYSVYGHYPRNKKNALFFSCHFSKSGKMTSVKVEKDLRKKKRATKAAKNSCKAEAASVWRTSSRRVKIISSRTVKSSRYHITVTSGRKKAICDVNARGHIYSFKNRTNSNNRPSNSNRAKTACKNIASKYWMVPASRISISRLKKNRYGRYNATLRYAFVEGKCDASKSGRIHHFKTSIKVGRR